MTRFYFTDTNAPASIYTGDFEKRASLSETPSNSGAVHSASILAQVSGQITHLYWADNQQLETISNWATTGYGVSVDVAAAGADLSYSIRISRMSSDGTTDRSIGAGSAHYVDLLSSQTGTGIKTTTNQTLSLINNDAGSRLNTDRLALYILTSNSNMMNTESLDVRYSDSDSWVEALNATTPLAYTQSSTDTLGLTDSVDPVRFKEVSINEQSTTLEDHSDTVSNSVSLRGAGTSSEFLSQTFQPGQSLLTAKASLYLGKQSNPVDNIWVELHEYAGSGTPTGALLATSTTVSGASLVAGGAGVGGGWVDFAFPSPVYLTAGSWYSLELHRTSAPDTSNFYVWFYHSPSVFSGQVWQYEGAAWSTNSTQDLLFDLATAPYSVLITDSLDTQLTGSGGLSQTPNDTIGLTDTVAIVSTNARLIGDSENLTDTVSVAVAADRNLADNLGVTDSVSAGITFFRTFTETENLTETHAESKFQSLQILSPTQDGTTVGSWVNEVGGTTNLYQSIDEASPGSTADYVESPANTASTDFYRTRVYPIDAAAPKNLTDDQILTVRFGKDALGGRTYSMDITIRDGANNLIATRTYDTVATETTDTTSTITLTGPEKTAIQDYTYLSIEFNPTSVSGGQGRVMRIFWVEYQMPMPDYSSLSLSGLTHVTDELFFGYGPEPSDALGPTDSLSISVSQSKTDSLGLTDATSRVASFARNLSDSTNVADAVVTASTVSLLVSDTVGLTESVATSEANAESITESVGLSDTVNPVPDQSKTDPLGVTDAISASLAISRANTETVSLTDQSATEAGKLRQIDDSVTLSDATALVADYSLTVTDSLGATDSLVASVGFVIQLSDSCDLTDAVNTQATEPPSIWRTTYYVQIGVS